MRGRLVLVTIVLALAGAACTTSTTSTPPDGGAGTTPGSTPAGSEVALVAPITVAPDAPGVHRFDVYWTRDCPGPEVATDVAGCRLAVGESRTTTSDDVARAAIDAL